MANGHFSVWRRVGVVWAIGCGLGAAEVTPGEPASAERGWEAIEPVPRRFSRHTDANGCRWGLDRDGAVGLSGSTAQPTLSLFKQAGRLSVAGQPFSTRSAAADFDGTRVRLTGVAGDVPVVRDIWIDRDRGGVRFCDSLTNTSDEAVTVVVRHEMVFDQPVPGIHRRNGDAVQGGALDLRDGVLAFLQNQPEGMSSAVVVAGDAKAKGQPRWSGAVNAEAQALEWSLEIPAQGSASLVSWLLQRPVLSPGDVASVVEAVSRHGRLVRPRLDQAAIATLANFPSRGLSADDATDGADDSSGALAAVVRFADRLGIERGESDVYYMNAKSLLEGVATGGPLVVESRFGALTVPLAEVAAVQGGGGRGRWPRVFLRDGHVLSGPLTLPDWKISGTKGWAITLHADTLEAVVLRATPEDGTTTEAPEFIAQLTSGDTVPVRLPPDSPLPFITPWGPLEITAADVTSLQRVREPSPACRLALRDGTRLTVLPGPRELAATSSRLGSITLQVTDLATLWPAGSEPPGPETQEEEIASIDELDPSPHAHALLRGSSVLAATLADPTLTLVSGGTETQLSTQDVVTLTRTESSGDAAPSFAVTLASGASFEGSLSGGRLSLKARGGPVWPVPLSQFLGWRQGTPNESR